ncbi:hypothetical protein JYU34_009887 [Plutella xylostella]|uniref:Protein quiver n=1 Tax=Plutella xylostella TaxID=51655 RepID=A0ABQ7QLU2_PLUXY|nr:hypothetical protein JYU34_009887 [Plutella xylostella]
MYYSYCFMFIVFVLSLPSYVNTGSTIGFQIKKSQAKSLPRNVFVKKATLLSEINDQDDNNVVSYSTTKVYTKKHNRFKVFGLHNELQKKLNPNRTEELTMQGVYDDDDDDEETEDIPSSSSEDMKITLLFKDSSNQQLEQTTISKTKINKHKSDVATSTRSWLQVLKMYYDPDYRNHTEFKEIKDYVESVYNKEILLNEQNHNQDDYDEVEPDDDLEDGVIPYAETENAEETTCHQCGYNVGWIPQNTNCYDYFEQSSNAGGEMHKETITTCKTTEGCFKGFLDVDHRFLVRGCASTYHYPEFDGTKTYLCGHGKHVCNTTEYESYIRGRRDYFDEKTRSYNQATERYLMLLELMKTKANVTQRELAGCTTSPVQVPVVVDREHHIQLFLRHHVCVCQGDYCNSTETIRNEFMFTVVLCLLAVYYFVVQ